eukprot:gnl/TRDRNA2_/TRDRNA2_106095_c0_seq1.p1 gnl/TRDRNA2_/TRDRNA2_106095_c0~~gnl/TRDRNA2_/TRDRNA2_106095_c0_seq1.p1  ORF type:complete len:428 (+),score=48.70 gnl/TRDRNA2_/TRDRNA2_106095_c0_seq1:1-1284(+)
MLLLEGHGLDLLLVERVCEAIVCPTGPDGKAGKAVLPGERTFHVLQTLISMGALEMPESRPGTAAVVKPFCASVIALCLFESKPELFEDFRKLCGERSDAIYTKIDSCVTQPVLALLSSVAREEPTGIIRQDDPGLVPPFQYFHDKSTGQPQSLALNSEIAAARALALIALSLADVFASDMRALFASISARVMEAPPKNCQRMLNKLFNPFDHGDPDIAIPRPARNVDIIRACVVVFKWEDIDTAYRILQARYRVLRVKNSFGNREGSSGYRALLLNFAYTSGVTWKQMFGVGHFDRSLPHAILGPGHIADDTTSKTWLSYIQSLPHFKSWAWGLHALWNISSCQPMADLTVAAEVQVLYEPYLAGRAQSHLLFKVARCVTGPSEMVRDFYEEFLKKQSHDAERLAAVRTLVATAQCDRLRQVPCVY